MINYRFHTYLRFIRYPTYILMPVKDNETNVGGPKLQTQALENSSHAGQIRYLSFRQTVMNKSVAI